MLVPVRALPARKVNKKIPESVFGDRFIARLEIFLGHAPPRVSEIVIGYGCRIERLVPEASACFCGTARRWICPYVRCAICAHVHLSAYLHFLPLWLSDSRFFS